MKLYLNKNVRQPNSLNITHNCDDLSMSIIIITNNILYGRVCGIKIDTPYPTNTVKSLKNIFFFEKKRGLL